MPDQQQSLNQLLQWSIQNSSPSTTSTNPPSETLQHQQQQTPSDPSRGLTPQLLSTLLGGPSDADLMRASMAAITAPSTTVPPSEKLTAWSNFELLIEQIDNANNLAPLNLWEPLLAQLASLSPEARLNAAACCATAVQNNVTSQDVLWRAGGVATLVGLAVGDPEAAVRKKAIGALSSEVRNFQPGMEELETSVPESVWVRRGRGVDAADMDACDEIIQALRDHSAAMAASG